MNGVLIEQGNIALGAKDSFNGFASEIPDYVSLNSVQKDIMPLNYGNPCELYRTVLDGSFQPIVENEMEGIQSDMGYVSVQSSDANGQFIKPIEIQFISSQYFSSIGLTFKFDRYNEIFPKNIKVEWYRDSELLKSMNYAPDSSTVFCREKVELYNMVKLTVYDLNMPLNRFRLFGIQYGFIVTLPAENVRSVSVNQSISPVSTEVPIDTISYVIETNENMDLIYEENQPVKVFFNDELIQKVYVKKARRKSKYTWVVDAESAIRILDKKTFYGDLYKDVLITDVLNQVFSNTNVEYELSDDLKNETLTGYIEYGTGRTALQQIAFAVGATVITAGRENVLITKPETAVAQNIPLSRISQGQNFEKDAVVTAIEITIHGYEIGTEETQLFDANSGGTGRFILVKFQQPIHDLRIENGNIIKSGTNYAIIDSESSCKLFGKTYIHTQSIKRITNDLFDASTAENVLQIGNATLINNGNVDNVLQSCYNEFINLNTVDLGIIEAVHEAIVSRYGQHLYGESLYSNSKDEYYKDTPTVVGDVVSCETEYYGDVVGRITKQSFNLAGNIKIKNSSLKGSF